MSESNDQISRTELVAAITVATTEVFSTMLGIEITPGETQTEPRAAAPPESGVVSLIGLAGPWVGTGGIACTGALACRISAAFLTTTVEAVNDDVLDAVGEITNMIIGNVKTAIEEKVGPMGLSTPTVIFGRNFQTRSARIHEWTVVAFTCEDERLYVQLCVAPNQEPVHGTIRAGFQVPQVLNI